MPERSQSDGVLVADRARPARGEASVRRVGFSVVSSGSSSSTTSSRMAASMRSLGVHRTPRVSVILPSHSSRSNCASCSSFGGSSSAISWAACDASTSVCPMARMATSNAFSAARRRVSSGLLMLLVPHARNMWPGSVAPCLRHLRMLRIWGCQHLLSSRANVSRCSSIRRFCGGSMAGVASSRTFHRVRRRSAAWSKKR